MWTPTLIDIKRNRLSLEFVVGYSEGNPETDFTATHIGDRASLEGVVRNDLARLARIDQVLADKETYLGPITLPPEPIDTRTQAELDFVTDVALLYKINNAVTQKILLDTDTQVTNLRSRIRSALSSNPGWIKYF